MIMSSTKQNRIIGLIGLGHWGKNLLRNFGALDSILLACDESSETTTKYQKEYPDIQFTNNISDILNNPNIQAVAIIKKCPLDCKCRSHW